MSNNRVRVWVAAGERPLADTTRYDKANVRRAVKRMFREFPELRDGWDIRRATLVLDPVKPKGNPANNAVKARLRKRKGAA